MYKKLDIEIGLQQRYISDGVFNHYKQILSIKVNCVDERFQVFNVIKNNELFISTNGLRILATLELPLGGIYDKALVLPSPKSKNITMYYEFMYDFERMEYLKRLYKCLQDWSEHWWGFSGDSPSKIVVYDNRWIIECETPSETFMITKKDKSLKFNDDWMDREIDNENVFLIT